MMGRNGMIGKILDRTPGLYFHVSFKALGWIIAFTLVIIILCVQTIHISLNPGPREFPMFIDGKKIVFMGREPQSVAEARDILARFNVKIKDGQKVVVNE